MPAPTRPLRGLYLVTPDTPETGWLLARLDQALGAAPALVQYRSKSGDDGLKEAQARAVLALCRSRGAAMVVNDDWRLAGRIGADGAHLGQGDGSLAEARAALGADAILGATCHDRLDLAGAAADAGASYLAFGAFFSSSTKPGATPAEPSVLARAASLGLPRVAIGGIRPENTARLVAAGADMVAVVGAVFDAPDPLAAARAFQNAFQDPTA